MATKGILFIAFSNLRICTQVLLTQKAWSLSKKELDQKSVRMRMAGKSWGLNHIQLPPRKMQYFSCGLSWQFWQVYNRANIVLNSKIIFITPTMLGLPWQSRQHRCVCAKLVILPSPVAQQLFFPLMTLLFCWWLMNQAAGTCVALPQTVSIQICSSYQYLIFNFWPHMQHFRGWRSDRDHAHIYHL